MRVLITGANRGVGAALLAVYAARGDTVTGTARQPDAELWPLDVTDPAAIATLAARFARENPEGLDLLICNAGVYLEDERDLDNGIPADIWADTFAVNVTGVYLMVEAMLPALRRAKGRVAIVGSQMGSSTRATGGSYVYRASKAAALNLGRNLATDLKGEGIAVGVYHPGWVRTDMGGSDADIDVTTSARGLVARFDALNPATTGVFEMWDGRAMPF